MADEIIECFQGDLSEIKNVRPALDGLADILPADWKCYKWVEDVEGNVVVASEEVATKVTGADGKERFPVAVEPDETATLEVPAGCEYQDYIWHIRVENTALTPVWRKTEEITLRIKP